MMLRRRRHAHSLSSPSICIFDLTYIGLCVLHIDLMKMMNMGYDEYATSSTFGEDSKRE